LCIFLIIIFKTSLYKMVWGNNLQNTYKIVTTPMQPIMAIRLFMTLSFQVFFLSTGIYCRRDSKKEFIISPFQDEHSQHILAYHLWSSFFSFFLRSLELMTVSMEVMINNVFDMAIFHNFDPKHPQKPSIKSLIVQKVIHDSIPENNSLYPKALTRPPIVQSFSVDGKTTECLRIHNNLPAF